MGKKKTDRYREPGSAQGVTSIHLFTLQILINTSFQPKLSHFLLPGPYKRHSGRPTLQPHTGAKEAERQEKQT